MYSNQSHFYSLNQYLRDIHGEKVMKISIDAGFTCPNRDGKKASGGCIFCSSNGSGDFAGRASDSIYQQMQEGIDLLSTKWPNTSKYIAYFQSYSNTYDELRVLKSKYETALSFPGVVGLAIATRPDCLPEETITYLSELNQSTHLWLELGLQTIHPRTSEWINRGHDLKCFEDAVYALNQQGIDVVVHIIVGLPDESTEDILETARYLSRLPIQGIKIHMLHVIENSPLAHVYRTNPFTLLSEDDYIFIVGEILKILPPHIVIHRLTGDADKQYLIAPLWTTRKTLVLNHIHKYLRENNIFQGVK